MPVIETDRTLSSAFDEMLVDGTVVHRPSTTSSAPSHWTPAPLIAWLHRQPLERRETLLAGGFAVAALLLGFVGVAAVVVGRGGTFVLLTGLAVLIVLSPRPPLVAKLAGRFTTWAAERWAARSSDEG